MNRRTVIASVSTALPLFAGCSESGTGIDLGPEGIRVIGSADDGWTWDVTDVTFDLVYELSGRNEDEGLYGVVSHLIDDQGTEISRVEHGELA